MKTGLQDVRLLIELPKQEGFNRTPFGFYVTDHKAPANMEPAKTHEWLYRDGTIPIPNTYWSMVATLGKEELERIENPGIREETRNAQQLMLEYPAQFVGLMAIGNRILIEPYGFGVKVLEEPLKPGHIEIYDHDISKIKLGKSQERYHNAKLWVDESVSEDDVRFAVRNGGWGAGDGRFGVDLNVGPRDSFPVVAGLGFRPEGNQAYFNVNKALEQLAGARALIQEAENHLK